MAINLGTMEELEALVNTEDAKSGVFTPFFFSLKDGQKALVRPLLNMTQYVRVDKHELYNPATNSFDVKAVCASSLQLPDCSYCAQVAHNKKLMASPRVVLPVYVHAVLDVKTGAPITYKKKNDDGTEQELPVKGVRLLEMKRSSSILRDLIANYNEDDNHDITCFDFVVTRKNIDGDKLQTTYTVIAKRPRDIPDDIPADYRDRDRVLLMYAEACPWQLVEGSTAQAAPVAPVVSSSTQGKVKNAPDF